VSGIEQGKLTRAGSGSRGNAFRYTLPATSFDRDVDRMSCWGFSCSAPALDCVWTRQLHPGGRCVTLGWIIGERYSLVRGAKELEILLARI
jgi:hypothetical protein